MFGFLEGDEHQGGDGSRAVAGHDFRQQDPAGHPCMADIIAVGESVSHTCRLGSNVKQTMV